MFDPKFSFVPISAPIALGRVSTLAAAGLKFLDIKVESISNFEYPFLSRSCSISQTRCEIITSRASFE